MSDDVYMALDRLADENPECEPGRDYLACRASEYTGVATAEDVRKVLKYSGGEIAIQWIDTACDRAGYVRWTPDGLEYMWPDGIVEGPPESMYAFGFDVQAGSVQQRPVLADETPLTESDRA